MIITVYGNNIWNAKEGENKFICIVPSLLLEYLYGQKGPIHVYTRSTKTNSILFCGPAFDHCKVFSRP